ncbi:MAG: hypothetical protein ACFCBU_17185 [Cyanophyceae cyanobacterium]
MARMVVLEMLVNCNTGLPLTNILVPPVVSIQARVSIGVRPAIAPPHY